MLRKLTIGLTIVCAATGAVAGAADWTQFQGNACHTGYVPGTFDPATFAQLWSVSAPHYSGGPGDRAVAIDENTVYATMLEGYSAAGPYHVLALDLLTGAEQWRHSIPANSPAGVSAPSLAAGRIYVHHWGHSSSSGSTYPDDYPAMACLSADTGDMLFWTTHSGQWYSGSRPTPEGDQVFAAGGYYGGLDAYGAEAGDKTWFTGLPQQDGWVPAADDDHVYVYMGWGSASPGPSPGRLYVMDRQSGGIEYEILHPESEMAIEGSLENVVLGGQDDALAVTEVPFAPSDRRILVSFDLQTQSIRWQCRGDFTGNMAVANGTIAIPDGGELSFIDEATGNLLWSWQAGASVSGNVVLTDNLAFVNAGNSVHAIDLLRRESVWSVPIKGDLAMAHGVLVISNPGGVTAFQAVPEPSATCLAILGAAACILIAAMRQRSARKK